MIIDKLLTKKVLLIIICLLPILLVYSPWFSFNSVSAGDAGFHFKENLKELSIIPYTWSNIKVGDFRTLLYPFFYLSAIPSIFSFLPWGVAEKVMWYWPFLLIGSFSSWYLVKLLLPQNKFLLLAPFIYLLNTYILMIVGGGQISIALAYAVSPFLMALFIKSANDVKVSSSITTGLFLSLALGFEPRITSLSIFISFLYIILVLRVSIISFLNILVIPFSIAIGIHLFWLLPSFMARFSAIEKGLSTSSWVEFLSFVNYSDSLSMHHPNWPENIFGKTSFFRSEFLILPIIAFSSLLLAKYNEKKNRVKLVFWLFILLLGAYLGKGVKPPLGAVYLWSFRNLPGMSLFRDSSKFYLIIVTAFIVLIPIFLESLFDFIKVKVKNINKDNLQIGLTIIFIFIFGFLSREAVIGTLGGTFVNRKIPIEYLHLQQFIKNQHDFSRILWLPKKNRFGFMSNLHPAIDADNYISNSVCLEPFCSLSLPIDDITKNRCFTNERCYPQEFSYLKNTNTQKAFSDFSIKYVIIPSDVDSIYFVKERTESNEQRQMLVNYVDQVSWLKKVDFDKEITIYENVDHKDLFFIDNSKQQKLNWRLINPTKYSVVVENAQNNYRLAFSQNFHPLWKAKVNGQIVNSESYGSGINSFFISGGNNSEIIIYFELQKWVYIGGFISILTIIICLFLLHKYKKRK